MQQLLTRASWKGTSMFYKFYCRSKCTADTFQSRVLQLKTVHFYICLNLQNEIHNFINAGKAWNEIKILWANQIDIIFQPQPTIIGALNVALLLLWPSSDNLSPLDSNIACLCQSIEINNNNHVYRQSQVRMPKRQWGRVGWMLADHRDGLSSSSF